jgi:ribosomal protein L16/L10AE
VSTQDSQATLPGATVSVDDSSNRTITKTAFNLNNVALDATITISFIGYESSQFTANELFSAENCRKILLKPSKEELNQVMINVYPHLVYRNILMEARF